MHVGHRVVPELVLRHARVRIVVVYWMFLPWATAAPHLSLAQVSGLFIVS